MFCNKCGNELEKDARFCSMCGNETKCGISATTVSVSNTDFVAKKTDSQIRVVLVVMTIIIVTLVSYIVVDLFNNRETQTHTGITEQQDENAELAIAALTLRWKELYEENHAGDGHLEIIHTRIVEIDTSVNREIFSKWEKGAEIKYIVEFEIYTDYYGSAPYYHNTYTYDTVVIYEDGTTSVTDNILRLYSAYTYSYDYTNLVVDIKDYGTTFNRIIDVKVV